MSRPRSAELPRPVALVVAVLAWGCSSERVPDDPWSGRWSRAFGAYTRSELALWQEAGEWRACWTQSSPDPGSGVRCREGGGAEVVRDGAVLFVYDCRVRPTQDGALELEVQGRPAPGTPGTEIRWKDRLVIEPATGELLAYAVELNGQPRPAGAEPLRFSKLASD